MSDGIDLRFRRSNQTFGTSLSFENDILSLLNNRGDILSSVNIDLIKKEELPVANADNLGVIYLYTGPDDEYKHGYFYECVENSGVYSWENIVVQDSYLKSETYNKTETDTELAKKLNTDGSNTFTGVLKMRASVSFKGAIAPSWRGIGIYELNDDDSVSLMASMEKIDGFTPADNNTYNIGVNSRKWKNLYLAGKAYIPTINNGADISVPSVGGTMALTSDIAIGKNNITNCITKIPQDIIVEIDMINTSAILKAGSKVYVPNGFEQDGTTPKFDEKPIESDVTKTFGSGNIMFFAKQDGTLDVLLRDYCYSGPTAPTSFQGGLYAVWYDTTNNVVKRTGDGGSTWTTGYSLPVFIGNVDNTYQVFNGFGYIGSTIYALPGVKGLIPDGRNADGSLKSIEITVENVLTSQVGGTVDGHLLLNASGFYSSNNTFNYNIKENFNYQNNNKLAYLDAGLISISSGVITNFISKTVFHAVDYSDKETIAGWGMPSSRYIDLPVGASGTAYTAPANGYFFCARTATAAGQILQVEGSGVGFEIWSQGSQRYSITVPARKGQVVYLYYTMPTANDFKFIYAGGEV